MAIKILDHWTPADGSAFELTAEKHSALLEVGGRAAGQLCMACAAGLLSTSCLPRCLEAHNHTGCSLPRGPYTPAPRSMLSGPLPTLQALVGRNFAHHPNLVQASSASGWLREERTMEVACGQALLLRLRLMLAGYAR